MDSKEELKTSDYLKGIVLNLPDSPGIYQYLNTEGTIIYVGKAKNLKRRVYSYFAKEHQSAKTRILVSKIADIKYIVVNSEEDALLLENNLIKKYKPRYNVLLKDDKSYPSICISNEYFPRVFKTRKIIRKESYQELQRAMYRTSKPRRIHEADSRNKRDSERQYTYHKRHADGRDAEAS